MKSISLTRILKANWDDVQADLNNGMLFVDVFAKLDIKYGIKRAYTTWHTTYSRLKLKMDDADPAFNAVEHRINREVSFKSKAWSATDKPEKSNRAGDNTGGNFLLDRLNSDAKSNK